LSSYLNSALFSETERLVLEYADAMTQTPVDVAEAPFAKLREKFSDASGAYGNACLGKLPGTV